MENLLNNNSSEMSTVVETFIVEETAALIYDGEQLEKWNKYVEELGLKGQTQIVKKDKSPIPFMPMKDSLKSVFEMLCPRKVKVAEYDVTPIPLEILDLIALSKNEGYFEIMEIWYDDKQPDPLCVGLNYKSESDRKNKYTFMMQPYLIGKWSDMKRSFAELTEMAKKRYIVEQTASYKQTITTYQRLLDDLDNAVAIKFGDNSTSDLQF